MAVVLLALLPLGWFAASRGGSRAPTAAAPDRGPLLSLAQWLAGHSRDWRVARLLEHPDVTVIEFPSLAEQGLAMNRVAALLEKRGAPRDRLLDDRELAALIARGGDVSATFYQGHDYGGGALARFFNLATAQRLALNPNERRLLDVLLGVGALERDAAGGGAVRSPGTQAVVSFTATQADDPATMPDETIDERRRESVLMHEVSHGRFHTQPGYRDHCRAFWTTVLTAAQREAIRRHLSTIGYDPGSEDLMIDEAQAFLMHTADARAFSAADIGLGDAELAALRDRFWRTLPADAAAPRSAAAAPASVTPAARPAPAAAARP